MKEGKDRQGKAKRRRMDREGKKRKVKGKEGREGVKWPDIDIRV